MKKTIQIDLDYSYLREISLTHSIMVYAPKK